MRKIKNERFGEDLKKNVIKGSLVLFVIIIISMALFYFLDVLNNGAFVDWFTKEFITKRDFQDQGINYVITDLNWYKLKRFLLGSFILSTFSIYIIINVVVYKSNKKYKEKCLNEISQQIKKYMTMELSPEQVFSSEYTEISMQMMEYKTTTQKHERLLKEEADRKKDLITYLAHDLKTPLTSVIGYLSLLDEASDMPEEQRKKYVHITLNKSIRLERLINEFFDIIRYNLQQISLEMENIDLFYMLFQMKEEFYPVLQEHGNTIKLNASEEITVCGDAIKLARVFNNIIKNAVAYSDLGTEILISADHRDNQTIVMIQNHGKTIPAHKLERIFEKFFRLDEARSTNTGGAGLGLAIAKDIVQLHGGTITADSKDMLTTFTVTLPDRKL